MCYVLLTFAGRKAVFLVALSHSHAISSILKNGNPDPVYIKSLDRVDVPIP